ncbi:unnamed protein product [Dovyalis caffra]|uniref:Uncharacterized protein n=1 Tax=Dovyalis caffra TaxID=77055 RepID=A0AAV1RRV4_9ROSI|nr:unnamed protein product [Dovyalis caffra]
MATSNLFLGEEKFPQPTIPTLTRTLRQGLIKEKLGEKIVKDLKMMNSDERKANIPEDDASKQAPRETQTPGCPHKSAQGRPPDMYTFRDITSIIESSYLQVDDEAVQVANYYHQLSMVGCPVCSILLSTSIPKEESDELSNGSILLTQQSNHEPQRNFLTKRNDDTTISCYQDKCKTSKAVNES